MKYIASRSYDLQAQDLLYGIGMVSVPPLTSLQLGISLEAVRNALVDIERREYTGSRQVGLASN